MYKGWDTFLFCIWILSCSIQHLLKRLSFLHYTEFGLFLAQYKLYYGLIRYALNFFDLACFAEYEFVRLSMFTHVACSTRFLVLFHCRIVFYYMRMTLFSHSLCIHSPVEHLDCFQCCIIMNTAKQFSKMVVLVYPPSDSEWEFHLLYILANSWSCQFIEF